MNSPDFDWIPKITYSRVKEAPISLTPKAFEILLVLVENGSRLTTKEELMRKVWPDSFVEEANLTVNISALRKQLGETPDGQQYIETVPKKGYRFAVPVSHSLADNHVGERTVGHPCGESLPRDFGSRSKIAGSAPKSPWERLARTRSWFRLVMTVLACSSLSKRLGLQGLSEQVCPAAEFAALPRRLAVLPFQNLQEDANTDFLGFSLADAIITKLGYVSELNVRPSYAIQRYEKQPIDIPKSCRGSERRHAARRHVSP